MFSLFCFSTVPIFFKNSITESRRSSKLTAYSQHIVFMYNRTISILRRGASPWWLAGPTCYVLYSIVNSFTVLAAVSATGDVGAAGGTDSCW